MNSEKFAVVINNYIERFEQIHQKHRETYKWPVIHYFQSKWDLESDNLSKMIKESFSKDVNLIGSMHSWPIGGLVKICEKSIEHQEYVREAFKKLLSYDKDSVNDRRRCIDRFVTDINNMLLELGLDGAYMQNYKDALMYIAFVYPEENYMLKISYAHTFADYMEYGDDIGWGSTFNMTAYYRLCDQIVEELDKYPEFIELFDKALIKEAENTNVEKVDADTYVNMPGKMRIIAYDVMYSAWLNKLYDGLDKPIPRHKAKNKTNIKAAEMAALNSEITELEQKVEIQQDELDTIGYPDALGLLVNHKKYGAGLITEYTGRTIHVVFSKKEVEMQFPEAFAQGFLTSIDEEFMTQCKDIFERKTSIKKLRQQIVMLTWKKEH